MNDISQYQFLKNFGENLKAAFKDSGMTLNELSNDTGISIPTLSRCMNGLQMPSLKEFINIMCALDLEPEELVDFNRRVVK